MTRAEAETLIAEGDASVAVLVPEGFGDDLSGERRRDRGHARPDLAERRSP